MADHAAYIRSADADQTIAQDLDTVGADAAQSAADLGSVSARLEYLASMIAELRDMACVVPQSSLPAILDSALIEAQIQLRRYAK